jgi:protein-L-isoaspartate(D-aspartate) O-methyltransferase
MRQYEDSYRHKGLRKQLIATLRTKGITDERVLQAMNNLPRHYFLDTAFDQIAYEDRAFPIGEGQTISQPYTVAYQTQLLEVKPFDRVLEIGTGSAYQACILAEMGAYVFTIERQKKLYDAHIERQKELYEARNEFSFKNKYPNLKFFYGDGFEGLPTYGPFDKVIITAAAPFIPQKLLAQMKPGATMVIPLDEAEGQRMLRLTKGKEEGSFREEAFEQFSFVPMLSGKNG